MKLGGRKMFKDKKGVMNLLVLGLIVAVLAIGVGAIGYVWQKTGHINDLIDDAKSLVHEKEKMIDSGETNLYGTVWHSRGKMFMHNSEGGYYELLIGADQDKKFLERNVDDKKVIVGFRANYSYAPINGQTYYCIGEGLGSSSTVISDGYCVTIAGVRDNKNKFNNKLILSRVDGTGTVRVAESALLQQKTWSTTGIVINEDGTYTVIYDGAPVMAGASSYVPNKDTTYLFMHNTGEVNIKIKEIIEYYGVK